MGKESILLLVIGRALFIKLCLNTNM